MIAYKVYRRVGEVATTESKGLLSLVSRMEEISIESGAILNLRSVKPQFKDVASGWHDSRAQRKYFWRDLGDNMQRNKTILKSYSLV